MAEWMLLFMMAKISKVAICCLLIFMLHCSAWTQQKTSSSDARKSPQAFVQDFYSWYAPIAFKAANDNTGPASDFALKYRKHVFSPELFHAIKEDADAQAKADEIVGLDFDPFLNSQDPCERYEVGSNTHVGNEYQVKVYAMCSGKKPDLPVVIAELVYSDCRWQFVNFLYPDRMKQYPDSADLLSNLKLLRDDRRRPPSSKQKATN